MSLEKSRLQRNPEKKRSSKWVVLRENKLEQQSKQHYGKLSWNPNHLPHSKNIEIDVEGINHLLKQLDVILPIELRNHASTEEKPQVNISQSSDNGELTAASSSTRGKRPDGGAAHHKRESLFVDINFQGLYRYLEGSLENGAHNPDFYQKYGDLLDHAFKEQLTNIIAGNFIERIHKEEHIQLEVLIAGVILFSDIVALPIATIIEFMKGTPLDMINDIPWVMIMNLAIYALFHLTIYLTLFSSDKEKWENGEKVTDLSQFMYERAINKDYSYFLYPREISRSYVIPNMIKPFVTQRKFFRGKK